MTRELARVLDEEFAALTPPSAITGASIVQKGRKVRRRRRFAYGGTGAAGVVVAVIAALLLSGLPGADPAPPAEVVQPDHPLPPLDPDEDYEWSYVDTEPRSTEASATTDAAWVAAVTALAEAKGAELLATVDYDSTQYPGGRWFPYSAENYSPVVLRELGLFRIVGGTPMEPELEPTGYTAPVLRGGRLALNFGGDIADTLSVREYAKGSFVPGAGQPHDNPTSPPAPYLVAGCTDHSYDLGIEPDSEHYADYACVEGVGPGGERVLTVETVLSVGSTVFLRALDFVMYRPDGTAVAISARVTAVPWGSSSKGNDAPAPTLESQDLLGLALALPQVVVG